MRITDILSPEAIAPELRARDKKGVIEELAELLARAAGFPSPEELARVLMERENLGSTGIGLNVAIPHAKAQGVNGIIAALGRSKEGVDFDAVDGQPVKLFFVLISGINSAGTHLKALAKISRLLKNDETREALISCNSRDEMYEIILQKERELD
jgi:PTS system nitrogen regulatory IIA component